MSVRRHNAFTVVELLVVIGIIGVLAAILLPAIQAARESANRASCVRNLGQCAFAVSEYANAKGFLSASRTVRVVNVDVNGTPTPTPVTLNWVYPVLPYLEQNALHKQIMTGSIPAELPQMDVLICPSQRHTAITGLVPSSNYPAGFEKTALSYVVNGGRANRTADNFDWIANGVFIDKGVPITDNCRIEDIAKYDGTSNTLMLAETVNAQSYLVAPQQQHSQMLWFPEDPNTFAGFIGLNQKRNALAGDVNLEVRYARPSSDHSGGFNVAMCDGSVTFMADNTDYRVYAVLMSSRGERANNPNTPPLGTYDDANPLWQSPNKWNTTTTPPTRVPNDTGPDRYPGTEF
ncbi:MAG: DUF1559 domain-containing protein [Planctomycetes bacterium]|nr:DUF1559 domain-containing protein [Planctomycetota bacterium]MBL7041151.1 DUF1559 domain-containing protein [Pirellulaceae bacterium]